MCLPTRETKEGFKDKQVVWLPSGKLRVGQRKTNGKIKNKSENIGPLKGLIVNSYFDINIL